MGVATEGVELRILLDSLFVPVGLCEELGEVLPVGSHFGGVGFERGAVGIGGLGWEIELLIGGKGEVGARGKVGNRQAALPGCFGDLE